ARTSPAGDAVTQGGAGREPADGDAVTEAAAGGAADPEAPGEAEPPVPPSGARRERRLADRAHELRRVALAIVEAVDDARSRPAPWSERVAWLRTLAGEVGGGRPQRRGGWRPHEVGGRAS